jgi:hypothetical protein
MTVARRARPLLGAVAGRERMEARRMKAVFAAAAVVLSLVPGVGRFGGSLNAERPMPKAENSPISAFGIPN